MIDITPTQMQDLLLEGVIDGVQVHKCMQDSYLKTYKDEKVIHNFEKLWSQDRQLVEYRIRCQSRHELDNANIFFNEKIDDYRCICFTWHAEQYCYLSKGVTANLNFCELFKMKNTYRKNVSLADKTQGILIKNAFNSSK